MENVENFMPFGIFYGHLGYCMTIWYVLCSSGTFFPILVSCTKKNLASLLEDIRWKFRNTNVKYNWREREANSSKIV
jgi:hypothetical protein